MSLFAKAFSPAVRELRILCCQTGTASAGIRQFIQSTYPAIKKANPDVPILIREAGGTQARVFARFEQGLERHVEVDNLSAADIERKVAEIVVSS
ncbi:NADH dehydrogenase [Dacryopinax primogenitus]|uniref:NADH dehydrogenase n=1 Tax=Dacryopinax primogenitus (strain DJM 731) TaxID=1858805 RepID=M5G7D0_DACPD|nr:NADH dehydrogenase [Dacryopinax primogenitus]EJT99672.1 NADH dehydrogenase [Dacryopinax primogenitus]